MAPPALELPHTLTPPQSVATDWWISFADAALTALVTEALQNNSDLARAVARIDESRALLALSHSDALPSLTANFSGSRAARAAYFPRIALTASLGRESAELSRLFDGPSLIWNLLASATQPIWGAGRLQAQSDAARARERIAELDYRDTVAGAFRDARDALGARSETVESLRLATHRASALARAAELTRLRHGGGEASQLAC